MRIEWDEGKARSNVAEHGVSFEEAAQLFEEDVEVLEIYDKDHSDDEDRFIAIGPIRRGIIVVVFTEVAEDTVRLISARRATKDEAERFIRHMERIDER